MHYTSRRAYVLLALIVSFFGGLVFLIVSLFNKGGLWAANKVNAHLYKGGQIVNAGTVYSADGEILAQSIDGKRVYNKDKKIRLSTLHAVGDPAGFIADGAHHLYREELFGYSFVNGVYTIKEYGRGNDVYLTLNAKACKAAYEALNGRKGTVGVYNYKTGEILCAVSAPSYDPDNKPKDMKMGKDEAFEGVYLNRLFSGLYTPGSVFKTVTAACVLENKQDISTWSYTCSGQAQIGEGLVKCPYEHGKMNFEEALNKSCNCAFAQLALEMGAEKLNQKAEDLGFGSALKIDKTLSSKSRFDLSNAKDLDLGWAASGQYTVLANPTHLMVLMGAIANGGQTVSPYFVEKIVTPNKLVIYRPAPSTETAIKLESETASKLQEMFRSNVTKQYGDSSFPKLSMCGKTGTAEVEDGKKPHAWFIGFSQREDLPLAIVVIVENGGSASYNAIPIANKVMQALL